LMQMGIQSGAEVSIETVRNVFVQCKNSLWVGGACLRMKKTKRRVVEYRLIFKTRYCFIFKRKDKRQFCLHEAGHSVHTHYVV